MRPAVVASMPPPAEPAHLVAGVAIGRFAMIDGRRQDEPWEALAMVEAFEPDTVPLLTCHGGVPGGYLQTLTADGPDLHLTANLTGDREFVERLRRGAPISLEVCSTYRRDGVLRQHRPEAPYRHEWLPGERSYYRGTLRPGPNLVGVAVVEVPAARGSCAWLVRVPTP